MLGIEDFSSQNVYIEVDRYLGDGASSGSFKVKRYNTGKEREKNVFREENIIKIDILTSLVQGILSSVSPDNNMGYMRAV